ncbi:MAG: hypothetical protein ACI39N_07440, partial [Lachnospiraceae bacterium]
MTIKIVNGTIKTHRKKRLDKQEMKYGRTERHTIVEPEKYFENLKKTVDNGRRTCYYKRVACEETGRSKEAKRTLTSEQQCNPENSKRD